MSFRPFDPAEAQVGFLFHVMIGINPLGEFRSVKGIGRNVEMAEIREGGRNHAPHTRVGPAKYRECTIEWGMSNRTTLYDWIHAVEAGQGYKRQVWVIQLARDRSPMRIYQLWDAWPISWEGAQLDANDNIVDTEQVTIVYEAVSLVTLPVGMPSLPLDTVNYDSDDATANTSGDINWDDDEAVDEELLETGYGEDEKGKGEYEATNWVTEGWKLTEEKRPDQIATFLKVPEEGEEVEEEEEEEEEPAKTVSLLKTPYVADTTEREAQVISLIKGEDDAATDDPTDETEAERPAPQRLSLSGGISFAPTVFEKLSLSGGAAADAAAEPETGDDPDATEAP